MDRKPRSRVREEKGALQRLTRVAQSNPEWVLGYEDETWWSRFEQPGLHSWAEAGEPMRLLQKEASRDEADPKALSCYGLFLAEVGQTWLRFVNGHPVSAITTQFLLGLPEARSSWQEGPASRLGQRLLAQELVR